MSSRDLRALLALVEKHGTVVVPARTLEQLASAEARGALHAARVVSPASSAATWPCDVRGCAREVRANHDGARKPLVAVCSQGLPECRAVELGFDDVANQEVSAEALVVAACALWGARVERAALAKVRERVAIGEARVPVRVGTVDEPARDVFWAGSPRDVDLGGFCARRERVERGTLVLVPTAARVAAEVVARFALGEHVEVRALADAIEARDGRLALVARGTARDSSFVESAPVAPTGAHGVAALLGVTRWEELRFTVVDGHTLRIEGNGKTILRTFVELGFVDGRKTDVVTPVRAWALLLLFCREGGVVRPSAYGRIGKAYAAKKAVETIGKALRGAFGIKEHPIRPYARARGEWGARFRVG